MTGTVPHEGFSDDERARRGGQRPSPAGALEWPLLWEMCVAHPHSGPRLREAARPPFCSHAHLAGLDDDGVPFTLCDWRTLVPEGHAGRHT